MLSTMDTRELYIRRALARHPEGHPLHDNAKRLLFWIRREQMDKAELERSPAKLETPPQKVDNWHGIREAWRWFVDTFHPRNLMP